MQLAIRLAGTVLFVAALAGADSRGAPEAPAATLATLSWMQGHWVMDGDAGRAEEIWMSPFDGSMVGSFRWAGPGGMHVLEFMLIEQADGVVTFRFKHFDRNYRAWEDSPNTYRLVRVEGNSARFENVAWTRRVPQTLIYRSPGPDRLTFRGASPDGEGEPLVLEYRRAD